MEKLSGSSKDLLAENIDNLKQIFPEAFTEDKIDFEALQDLLGNYIESGKERYAFTWAGKQNARREAQKTSTGTLRPCPEESVNFDTTENIYIEGDNLEVLKLLQKSYHNKIKMIYIDPPYNTGKDFVYKDNYHDNLQNYKEITGQVDSEGKRLSTNSDASGRFHSNWLNMMYPRLKLARNLLKDDGVIFISIDDNEVHNLRKICDEIFGEENFIDALKWKRKKQPSFLAKHTAKVMEYILVYSKVKYNLEKLSISGTSDSTKKVINVSNNESKRIFKKGVRVKLQDDEGIIKAGKYTIRTMSIEYLQDIIYSKGLTCNDVEVIARFSVSQDKIDNYICNNLLFITNNKGLRRDVSDEEIGKRKSITDLLIKEWGDNQDSDQEQRDIFNRSDLFDYTKPTKLIKNLIQSNFTEDEIILDFFAGSSSTAHAIMKLNEQDKSNRRFILIQLPEPLDDTEKRKTDNKAAIEFCDSISIQRNVSEIGKERIRRVINNIKKEADGKIDFGENSLDLGFKVLKLDSSNIKAWDTQTENLEEDLLRAVNNIKEDRSEQDILYEILIKYGFNLALPVQEVIIAGNRVFNVDGGKLISCLADNISLETVEGIAKLKEELNPDTCKVVFMDNGFQDDVVKTNAMHILMKSGIEEVRSI